MLVQLLIHHFGSILGTRVEIQLLRWFLEGHSLVCFRILTSAHHLLVVDAWNQSDPDFVSIGLDAMDEAYVVFEDTRMSDPHPDVFRQLAVLSLI